MGPARETDGGYFLHAALVQSIWHRSLLLDQQGVERLFGICFDEAIS